MTEEYIKGSGTGRGGWRGGGRKKGVKVGSIKLKSINFQKRVTPEEKAYLEKCLIEYRERLS